MAGNDDRQGIATQGLANRTRTPRFAQIVADLAIAASLAPGDQRGVRQDRTGEGAAAAEIEQGYWRQRALAQVVCGVKGPKVGFGSIEDGVLQVATIVVKCWTFSRQEKPDLRQRTLAGTEFDLANAAQADPSPR